MEELNKSIGGYFELELAKGEEYHKNAIKLNTGRNALEYILLVNHYKKIWLPFFTCDVLLEPINKLNIEVFFYKIDEKLEPIFNFSTIKENEAFLYTNYFGLKDGFINALANKCRNLIIDNAQAFYSKPITDVDTFYSPRKFFGIPDGAYLYCDKKLDTILDRDSSFDRCAHLLKRMDSNAEIGYKDFVANDIVLKNQPIKKMSFLTTILLASLNYETIAMKRKENFNVLHAVLSEQNKLKFDLDLISVPLVYPFWATKDLRIKLLEHKIYTATYWPNVKKWCDGNGIETKLTEEIIHIPIDQRYFVDDMKKISRVLHG